MTNTEKIEELEKRIAALESGGAVPAKQKTGNYIQDAISNVKSIEEMVIEKLNGIYAKRLFQKVYTEWEKILMEGKVESGRPEYEWVLQRTLEIHRSMNLGETNEKETADQISTGGGEQG